MTNGTTALPPWIDPSPVSVWVFLAICAFVVAAFVATAIGAGARRAWVYAGTGAWLAATGAAGASGALEPGPTPPPLLLFFVAVQGAAIALAFSPLGRRVADVAPLTVLIGVQAFRLPLELVLHGWHGEGVVPIQMTFEGWNYDVVTGVASGAAAMWIARRPPGGRAVALAVNALGFALLLVVMGLAVTSAPGPLYRFTDAPPILLPFHFPTVWIVSVCVAGALYFHLVTFRALLGRGGPVPVGLDGA